MRKRVIVIGMLLVAMLAGLLLCRAEIRDPLCGVGQLWIREETLSCRMGLHCRDPPAGLPDAIRLRRQGVEPASEKGGERRGEEGR